MSQTIGITLIVLGELVLALAIAVGVLVWRLRRARANNGVETLLRTELAALDDWPEDQAAAREARRQALTAELAARAATGTDSRRSRLAEAYSALANTAADTAAAPAEDASGGRDDAETERLRRLLDRENRKVLELLNVRERFQELQLRYDRVRRLLEQVRPDAAGGEIDTAALGTFLKAERAWHDAMTELGEDFGGVETPASGDADAPPAPPERDTRTVMASQAETVEALRGYAEGNDDATRQLDTLGGQIRELETCVQVLEDENHWLRRKLAGGGDATDLEDILAPASEEERDQLLAMKDQEIAELKQRLEGEKDAAGKAPAASRS